MTESTKSNATTRIMMTALPALVVAALLSVTAGLALLVLGGIANSWPAVAAGFLAEVVGGSWIWKLARWGQAGAASSNFVERLASAIAERSAPTN